MGSQNGPYTHSLDHERDTHWLSRITKAMITCEALIIRRICICCHVQPTMYVCKLFVLLVQCGVSSDLRCFQSQAVTRRQCTSVSSDSRCFEGQAVRYGFLQNDLLQTQQYHLPRPSNSHPSCQAICRQLQQTVRLGFLQSDILQRQQRHISMHHDSKSSRRCLAK